MPIFTVLLEDIDPETATDIRRLHMPAHLAFLESRASSIRAAGPMHDPATDRPAGGMWLVETDTAEAAMALVHADPFFPEGLRRSVRILEWRQVFADGSRKIR